MVALIRMGRELSYAGCKRLSKRHSHWDVWMWPRSVIS